MYIFNHYLLLVIVYLYISIVMLASAYLYCSFSYILTLLFISLQLGSSAFNIANTTFKAHPKFRFVFEASPFLQLQQQNYFHKMKL